MAARVNADGELFYEQLPPGSVSFNTGPISDEMKADDVLPPAPLTFRRGANRGSGWRNDMEEYLLSRDKKRLVYLSIQNNCYKQTHFGIYRYTGAALSKDKAIDWLSGKSISFEQVKLIGPERITVAGMWE